MRAGTTAAPPQDVCARRGAAAAREKAPDQRIMRNHIGHGADYGAENPAEKAVVRVLITSEVHCSPQLALLSLDDLDDRRQRAHQRRDERCQKTPDVL